MKFPRTILAAALLATLPAAASAATVSLARSTREVTPEEIAGGAPAGYIHDFFLTSDTDLLSFNDIKVDVPLFHDFLGSDTGPQAAALAALSPAISADSYLTTPGSTVVLGGGFADTGGGALWGDLSNDGAQHRFHFARLTTANTGHFTGQVAVRGYDAPVYLPFNFVLPGSAADLPLMASEPTYSLDYSLDPPPAPTPPVTPPTPPVTPPQPPAPPVPPVSPPAPPVDPPGNPNPPASPTLASLSLTRQSRLVTPEEVAGGAPAGGYVHEFFVNTATDILSINSINVDVPLFQDAFGSDKGRPADGLEAASSSITADSFIDTPGDTLTLGSGWTGDNGLWGDLSNDGAQEEFLFARLTVAETGTFTGQIDVRHDENFVSLPFEFLLPGSEADMALLACEPTYAKDFPPTATVPPPVEAPPVETPPSDPVYTPPVETPPIGEPSNPPIDDPYNPPSEPSNPPIVIYPPGYPIVDPPGDLPIDPVDPPASPYDPSLPGDEDDLVDELPPVVQPGEPTPENPDAPLEPPYVIDVGGVITLPGIIEIFKPIGEIDVTLPIDTEPWIVVRDGELFRNWTWHFVDYNGLADVIALDGMLEFTAMTGVAGGQGGLVAFDADGAQPQAVLFSTSAGEVVMMLGSRSLIPEPTGGLLALTAGLVLLATRRARSSK